MRVGRIARVVMSVFLCLLLFANSTESILAKEQELSESELYARAAVLMDAETGRILYGKNEEEKLSNASTTKIMTCILALEAEATEEIGEVSAYAAAQPKVHLGMQTGEHYQIKDLLYSLMLESHNDSAVVIAEHIGGKQLQLATKPMERGAEESKEAVLAFAAMMNAKAEEIGCTDTSFVTPNGLDAVCTQTNEAGETISVTHGTTAGDLAKIMAYCVSKSPKKDEFLEITGMIQYQFTNKTIDENGKVSSGNRSFSCNNHNAFLNMMEGALSGKTGFTNSAGYCYVGALCRDERIFTIALLACGWPNNKSYKWSDSKKLFSYGLDNYNYRSFTPEFELSTIEVVNGAAKDGNPYHSTFLKVKPAREKEALNLLVEESEYIDVEVSCKEKLEAPVAEGEKVGEVSIYLVDKTGEKNFIKTIDLLTEEKVQAISFSFVEKYVFGKYFQL